VGGARRDRTVAATSVASAAAFVALSAYLWARPKPAVDEALQQHLGELRRKRSRAARLTLKLAKATGPVGKIYLHGPMSLLIGAALVAVRGSRPHTLALLGGVSVVATLVENILDRASFFRAPPPSHPQRDNNSYPSGHALNSSAVAGAAAYIAASEGAVSPITATSLALLAPLLTSAGKLLRGRHWASDVAGGLLAGSALASASAWVYETRIRRHARLPHIFS
jgi:membrane-associated phospholipid phosphatase